MNFIFCKNNKPAGGPRSGPGGLGPPGLAFFGVVYESVLEGASDVVDRCCCRNWRFYNEERFFQYIFCFWYIFESDNGCVKNWRSLGLPMLFWNEFFFNPGILRIFIDETSMLNMYLYLQFLISKDINERVKKAVIKKGLESVERIFWWANTCWLNWRKR